MGDFPVLVWKEENGYITGCPITSVSTFGDTYEEAMECHKEAMELYIEDLSESEVEELATSAHPLSYNFVKLSLPRVKT